MTTEIDKLTSDECQGTKLVKSDSHIGLFFYTVNGSFPSKVLRCMVASTRPFHNTKLLLVAFRKFEVELYNYAWKLVDIRKSCLTCGVQVGFLRVIWNRF